MNAKLKALLVAAPVAVVAGIAYYIPKASTSQVELVDGGVRADCAVRTVACTFLSDPGDGGAPEYDEREFKLAHCPNADGGRPERIVPRWFARADDFGVHDLEHQCRLVGSGGSFDSAPAAKRPGSCACWSPKAGACTYSGPLANPGPGHNEFEPGSWSGPGCVPKPCGEVAGRRNWPKECPE